MSADPIQTRSTRRPTPAHDRHSAFDTWLKRSLQELYTLQDPISQELEDIIEQDRQRRAPNNITSSAGSRRQS